jgi:hypothetical protein
MPVGASDKSIPRKPPVGSVRWWVSVPLGLLTLVELIVASALVLECIDVLADAAGSRRRFNFLWWHGEPNPDTVIILLAIGAGVVGSFLMASSSYVKYLGNRQLRSWWIPWYFARAPIGAALAVIIYLALRGGLLPNTNASTDVSPYGVAAMAGLAGLFSNKAVEKFEKVFIALFGTDTNSRDALSEGVRPKITDMN